MNARRPSVFADEMLTLVYEGASLWEFPLPMIRRTPGGSVVPIHGAWDPDRCGAVLLRWFEAGWIVCTACVGGIDGDGQFVRTEYVGDWTTRAKVENGFFILDPQDARSVLLGFAAWASGPDRHIQFEVEDEYSARSTADWLALLDGLPEEWIHG